MKVFSGNTKTGWSIFLLGGLSGVISTLNPHKTKSMSLNKIVTDICREKFNLLLAKHVVSMDDFDK